MGIVSADAPTAAKPDDDLIVRLNFNGYTLRNKMTSLRISSASRLTDGPVTSTPSTLGVKTEDHFLYAASSHFASPNAPFARPEPPGTMVPTEMWAVEPPDFFQSEPSTMPADRNPCFTPRVDDNTFAEPHSFLWVQEQVLFSHAETHSESIKSRSHTPPAAFGVGMESSSANHLFQSPRLHRATRLQVAQINRGKFKCDFPNCPKANTGFHRREHLKRHKKIHDPAKLKFKCVFCPKEFENRADNYKVHIRLHARGSKRTSFAPGAQALYDSLPTRRNQGGIRPTTAVR